MNEEDTSNRNKAAFWVESLGGLFERLDLGLVYGDEVLLMLLPTQVSSVSSCLKHFVLVVAGAEVRSVDGSAEISSFVRLVHLGVGRLEVAVVTSGIARHGVIVEAANPLVVLGDGDLLTACEGFLEVVGCVLVAPVKIELEGDALAGLHHAKLAVVPVFLVIDLLALGGGDGAGDDGENEEDEHQDTAGDSDGFPPGSDALGLARILVDDDYVGLGLIQHVFR